MVETFHCSADYNDYFTVDRMPSGNVYFRMSFDDDREVCLTRIEQRRLVDFLQECLDAE